MPRPRSYPWGELTRPGKCFIWLGKDSNLRAAACKFAKRRGIVISCERLAENRTRVTYVRGAI